MEKKHIKRIGICILVICCCFAPISYDDIAMSSVDTIKISKKDQFIPNVSSKQIVSGGKVLYRIKIKVKLRNSSGKNVVGKEVKFSVTSGTASAVKIDAKTNAKGNAYASYDKRGESDFTVKVVAGSKSKSFSVPVARVSKYKESFKITKYYTPLETECTGNKITVSGVPNRTFKSNFISAVKMEGHGQTKDGDCLSYVGNNRYKIQKEPETASGTVPKAGKTIAVDNEIISRYYNRDKQKWYRGSVAIWGDIGYRRAEDSGGAIIGNHIDVYAGVGKKAYNALALPEKLTTVVYHGNNINFWK